MKVDKASKNIDAGLVIFTRRQHTWVLSEPDREGLRTVYFDGEEEGRGVLLGSMLPKALGYIPLSLDVEVGRQVGIKFPDRPKSNCVLISTAVTAIIATAKEKVAAKESISH